MDSPTVSKEFQKKRAIAELKVSKFVDMIRKLNNNPNLPVVLRVEGDNYELEWQMKPNWIGHVNVADLSLRDGEIVWPITSLEIPDKKYCCPVCGSGKTSARLISFISNGPKGYCWNCFVSFDWLWPEFIPTGPPKGKFHPTPFSNVLRKILSEEIDKTTAVDHLFDNWSIGHEVILKCTSLKIMSEYADATCREMASDVTFNKKQIIDLRHRTDIQHDIYSVSSVGNIAYLALNAEPKKHRAVWADFLKRYAKYRGAELKFEI